MAVVIPSETLHAAHLTATELEQELAVLLFQQHWTPRLAACMREKPKKLLSLSARGFGCRLIGGPGVRLCWPDA